MNEAPNDEMIAQAILDLTSGRGAGKSICPSEAARALTPETEGDAWRAMMAPVRRVAVDLARTGQIDILRKGKPIDPAAMRGVIRLRRRP